MAQHVIRNEKIRAFELEEEKGEWRLKVFLTRKIADLIRGIRFMSSMEENIYLI